SSRHSQALAPPMRRRCTVAGARTPALSRASDLLSRRSWHAQPEGTPGAWSGAVTPITGLFTVSSRGWRRVALPFREDHPIDTDVLAKRLLAKPLIQSVHPPGETR